jgi:hypothetical protein
MAALLSFRALTRSGAYFSSSGPMKVMAVPLLPARPVRPTLHRGRQRVMQVSKWDAAVTSESLCWPLLVLHLRTRAL